MLNQIKGFLFFAVSFSSVILIGFPLVIIGYLTNNQQLGFYGVTVFNRILFPILGIKITVTGKEHMDSNAAYLVLSNHQSFLDIIIILTHIRLIAFVAKMEIKKWPVFGFAMKQMHCIFVDRSDPESRKLVGPAMEINIRKKISYCVYPEGTRSSKGRLLPFKPGIFKIAYSNNISILPVSICDSWKILSKDSFKLSSGTIHCVIHKPVIPADFDSFESLQTHIRGIIASPLEANA
ncbi:MAG: 1-acyl-sn-glycerol-3-phosphate acyltransferase [Fibrobacteria bacterium]|nr:1-acyl-sn-glycerol-3-phosphate acyltransferase [Fibrobacteria bacterium]